MKRIIVGLGAGVYILLFLITPLPAFDRDINLPSQNASDPKSIYIPRDGDDTGWDDPIKSGGGEMTIKIREYDLILNNNIIILLF